MSLRALRLGLAATLALLAAAGVVFYHRQNAGAQIGGPISLPKMLWLGYALAAWFVVPFFLWRDARLEPSVRRLFGAFWLVMAARGVIELVLLYLFVHWNPVYGISHDLFCIALLVVLRRQAHPGDALSLQARRYSGSLMTGLAIEAAFAGMFLQTGAHDIAVYFASADASWRYVNLVTLVVLAFVYPDLLAALHRLYFPGRHAAPPRLLRLVRTAAACLLVLFVAAALGFWTYMAGVEAAGARFQRVGYEIVDSCVRFKDAFTSGDETQMADFIEAGDGSWQLEPCEHGHPFELKRWKRGGPPRSLLQAMLEWRRGLPGVAQAAFKIHLLDEVVSDAEAVAQVRFEVTGTAHTTDAGLIRCRFRRGDDGRWRVAEASLLEGTTVAGSGRHFLDLAAERGLRAQLEPDRRLLPGACDDPSCPDAIRLKFQTMRHAYAGCAAADYDGDGHDDVLFCSGGELKLFRNRGDGSFEEVTEQAGLAGLWHVNTAGFADLDNDGHQDLLTSAFFGPTRLFRNRGDGSFEDMTEHAGVRSDNLVTCFCFFDYDRDGRLDVYLGRFLDARTQIPDSFLYARNGEPNVLYRNEGDFRFRDVTASAGVGDRGLTLSLAGADYDGDGHQDVYVANDFGRNVLYRNQGDGTFKNVAREAGALAIGGSMSASWGDYDNDGRLDLYVGAIRSNQRWFVQPITARRVIYKFVREGRLLGRNPLFLDLYENLGENWVEIGNHALAGNSLLRQNSDGSFTEMADAAGARPAGWYWSCGFFDIDNDADLDIYAADGWISGKDPYDL